MACPNLIFGLPDYAMYGGSTALTLGTTAPKDFKSSVIPTTTNQVTFDLGSSFASEFPSPANFLAIQHLKDFVDQEVDGSVDIEIGASNDPGFIGEELQTISGVTLASLMGIEPRNYAAVLDNGILNTSRRYWRVAVKTNTLINPLWGSVALGNYIGLGKDPVYGMKWKLDDRYIQSRRRFFSIQIQFKGVDTALKDAFYQKVFRDKDVATVWMLDQEDYAFFGKKLIRGYLRKDKIDLRENAKGYDIRLDLDELL